MSVKYFHDWLELKAVDHGLASSLCKIKAITGDKLQLIWARFEPGGEYEIHSHPHEQFSFMVEGKMRLFVGDQEKIVGPGDIWYAPPNIVHGGELLEAPVIFIDVFTPIREDIIEEMKERGGIDVTYSVTR